MIGIIPLSRYEEVIGIDNFLTDDEIDQIHTHALTLPIQEAAINHQGAPMVDEEKRRSKVSWINPSPEIAWLYEKVLNSLGAANGDLFHLDLAGTEPFQYTVYEAPGGNYGTHKDNQTGSVFPRKLSFTIQLSDPETYTGGEVRIYDTDLHNPFVMKKNKGSLTVFLSTLIHEVTPVTEGTRYSLVGWISGPPLK